MTEHEFMAEVRRTTTRYDRNNTHPQINHAILGVASEAGELVDVIKKAECGKPANLDHLDEEFADILWYVGLYCQARGTLPSALMAKVAAKLRVRHTSGFNEAAMDEANRDREAERTAMSRAGGVP